MRQQLSGWLRRLSAVTYGCCCWAVMGLVGIPCWLLVLTLPKLSWRWRATRVAVHLLSTSLRIPVKVHGDPPPRGRPCVVVANHESILDSFAFFEVFAEPVVFVGGGDLATHPVTGPFLRGLGATFVRVEGGLDRSSVRSVLGGLAELVRAGNRLVFFPEGGLSPEPGLRRFQLGAFVVAGDAASTVVPVAIVGTRGVLPPGARLPRRGEVEVRVGEQVGPALPGWAAAREIAGQAKQAIVELLAEAPD